MYKALHLLSVILNLIFRKINTKHYVAILVTFVTTSVLFL